MAEDYSDFSYLYAMPTEILLKIFQFLPGKQLALIRQVCVRWRDIVDEIKRNDLLWRDYCNQDFGSIYKTVRHKARPGMSWFHIYRALSSWPRLHSASEQRRVLAEAEGVNDEVKSFDILKDGVIGVHKSGSIVYYDIETLQPSPREPLPGDYLDYIEIDDYIIIRSYQFHVFLVRKVAYDPTHHRNVTIDNVKTCLLVGNQLFYVNVDNEIYMRRLQDNRMVRTFIKKSEETVMCLGYTDRLNVLTYQRKIFSVIDDNLVLVCNLDCCSNLLHQFFKYKLIENLDWRIVFQWLCILRRQLPDGPLQEIMTVKLYGAVVLVGCNWGVLRLYYAPFNENGEFDLFNAKPVKQYNFMDRRCHCPAECPAELYQSPILKLDVMEAKCGHTILVAMPKKIVVLELVHNYN